MLPRESGFFKWNRRIPRFLPIAGHQRPLSIRWLVDERDGNLGEEEKKAEDALVHEKSKLFSYILPPRLCFLLSSFLASPCLFFFPFDERCWMFNESLKWRCFLRGLVVTFADNFFFLRNYNSSTIRFGRYLCIISKNNYEDSFLKYFFVHLLILLFLKFSIIFCVD